MKRVFAHIGFSFAVTLVILNFLKIEAVLAVLAAISALFVFSLVIPKTRNAVAVPLCLLCSVLACALISVNYYCNYLPQTELSDKSAQVEFYITDIEEETSSGKYAYTVKTSQIDLPNTVQDIKFTLYSDEKIYADYYQHIKADVYFFAFADNAYDSYGSFGQGIFLRGSLNEYYTLDENTKSLNKPVLEFRLWVRSLFEDIISGDEGALCYAVLTGDKALLSDEVYNDFKACGVTHLMAVSGLHLAVLAGLLYKLLRRLLIPIPICAVVCSFSVIFYIMLSGFSKSMLRSGIMMLVFLLAKLFKTKNDSLNSLGLAAFLICLNPYAVSDAGALLTFTAVLGLVTVNPHISALIKVKNKALRYVLNILSASVSVFITSFPVMCFLFGTASLAGLILNILFIPLSQIMLVSSVLFVAFQFAPYIMLVFANVDYFAADIMIKIVRVFADFSFSLIDISNTIFYLLTFCVMFLFGIAFILKRNNKIFKTATALSLVITVVILSLSLITSKDNIYVRALGGEESTAFVIYDRKHIAAIGINDFEQYYKAQNIMTSNNLEFVLLADTAKTEYSQSLSDENPPEYLKSCGYENSANDEKSTQSDYFDIDLWQGVNVKYNEDNGYDNFIITVYDTEFYIDGGDLSQPNEFDYIYTVNQDGYNVKGVSKWAE